MTTHQECSAVWFSWRESWYQLVEHQRSHFKDVQKDPFVVHPWWHGEVGQGGAAWLNVGKMERLRGKTGEFSSAKLWKFNLIEYTLLPSLLEDINLAIAPIHFELANKYSSLFRNHVSLWVKCFVSDFHAWRLAENCHIFLEWKPPRPYVLFLTKTWGVMMFSLFHAGLGNVSRLQAGFGLNVHHISSYSMGWLDVTYFVGLEFFSRNPLRIWWNPPPLYPSRQPWLTKPVGKAPVPNSGRVVHIQAMRPSEPSKQRKALSFSDWIGRKWRISATGGLVMIPIDKLIFFRGVETTNQI